MIIQKENRSGLTKLDNKFRKPNKSEIKIQGPKIKIKIKYDRDKIRKTR
jgi:hypothetical protein